MPLVTVPHAKEEMRLLLLSSMEMMSLIHCTVVYGLLLWVVCICVSSQELNHGACHKEGKTAFVGEKRREEEERRGEEREEEERGREEGKREEERKGKQSGGEGRGGKKSRVVEKRKERRGEERRSAH